MRGQRVLPFAWFGVGRLRDGQKTRPRSSRWAISFSSGHGNLSLAPIPYTEGILVTGRRAEEDAKPIEGANKTSPKFQLGIILIFCITG